MCCHHGPDFISIAAALSVVGYDLIVAPRSFFSWTRKRGLQSLKALGLLSAVVCGVGGMLYAGWGDLPSKVRFTLEMLLVTGIALFPLIDLILKRRAKPRFFCWRLPIALVGLYFFVFGVVPWFEYVVSLWTR